MHTGEFEMRDAGNYFGQTVIRCATLRSIGHGGQIGDVDRHDVFDLIDHLAYKSLIAMDEIDQAGESRYRLLETIRHTPSIA